MLNTFYIYKNNKFKTYILTCYMSHIKCYTLTCLITLSAGSREGACVGLDLQKIADNGRKELYQVHKGSIKR